ncbi:replication initiation factor domain-containing protein (plasmid) [Xanthomonas oryzae pv. oryzae]|nr:replication initiation factor domain-containing protein [Xanthomonas oryzae pv. oryzae]
MNPQITNLQTSIDWLEFTVMEFSVDDVLNQILELPRPEFSMLDKGRFGYQHQLKWVGGNVFVMFNDTEKNPQANNLNTTGIENGNENRTETDRMGIHVMISGTGVREYEGRNHLKRLLLFLTVLDSRVNFSRIDLAIDDFQDCLINFSRIHHAAIERLFTSRWNKWDEVNSRQSASGEFLGRTMYFGSQTSSIFCRIYDKTLERKANSDDHVVVPDHWTRLELIYKKERAKKLVYYLIDNKTPVGTAIRGTLNQYIRFLKDPPKPDRNKSRWPSADWWNELLAGVSKLPLTIQRKEKSIDDMEEWVERQIAPTIAAILTAREGDMDWLHEIISKGAQRLSQRHKDAIAQYLDRQEIMK